MAHVWGKVQWKLAVKLGWNSVAFEWRISNEEEKKKDPSYTPSFQEKPIFTKIDFTHFSFLFFSLRFFSY